MTEYGISTCRLGFFFSSVFYVDRNVLNLKVENTFKVSE